MNSMTWKESTIFLSRNPICARLSIEDDVFQEFSTAPTLSCLAPDGSSVAIEREEDHIVQVRRVVQQEWRPNSVEFICQIQTSALRNIAWSHDMQYLALLCANGVFHICKAKVARATERGKVVMSYPNATQEHSMDITALSFSPNSKFIATIAPTQGEIAMWGVRTGTFKAVRGHEQGYNTVLTWSPNGKSIAFGGGSDTHAYVWHVTTPTRSPLSCHGHTSPIQTLAWSPDGSRLASGDSSGHLFVWNTVTGQPLREMEPMEEGIDALTWSPDSKKLVVVAANSFDIYAC